MNEYSANQIVYSKNVIEFVTVANQFCVTIENVDTSTVQNALGNLQKILPLLYLKASLLPHAQQVLNEDLEKYVSELDYNVLHQKWLQALQENDSFYEVFDPNIQFGDETVTASISENLLDIYHDIKDFLTSYSLGNEYVMNDALYECVFHFEEFWGQQLVNVLRAVHKLIYSDADFSGETRDNEVKPGTGNPKWLDEFWGSGENEND